MFVVCVIGTRACTVGQKSSRAFVIFVVVGVQEFFFANGIVCPHVRCLPKLVDYKGPTLLKSLRQLILMQHKTAPCFTII